MGGSEMVTENPDFPFLIKENTMTAILQSGQILTFKVVTEKDGVIFGNYNSTKPDDAGTFSLTAN
jgi:guanyl-specific ribonuclease Sa